MRAVMMGLILAALFGASCFYVDDYSVEPSNVTVEESEETEMIPVSQSEDTSFQIRDFLLYIAIDFPSGKHYNIPQVEYGGRSC